MVHKDNKRGEISCQNRGEYGGKEKRGRVGEGEKGRLGSCKRRARGG